MSAFHLSRKHRSALIAWLVATLGIPVGNAAPAAAASNVHVRHALFGMHDGSLVAHGTLHEGSVRLWDVGVQWRDIELSPGVYSWSRLDALVSAAQAARAEVTMVVAMTPSFYASSPTDPPRRIGSYKNFVRALMTRYRSFNGSRGIAAYQVWNEINISTFWTGSQTQMVKLSKAMHDIGAQVDPNASIVSPPMVARLSYQVDYLQRFYAQKLHGTPVWRYYDILGFSLYPLARYGKRTGVPEDSMKLLAKAHKILRRDHVPGKPIWNTEVNYGLQSGAKGGTHAAAISDRRQAANVIRTYLLNAAHGVKRVFWYRYDMGLLADNGTIGNTRLSNPSNPAQVTRAGQAFVLAQQWLHGTLLRSGTHPPCHQDSHGTYHCVVKDSSGKRWIYWNPFGRAKVKVSRHVHHLQTEFGGVSTIKGGSTISVDYAPVMVDR